MKLKLNKFIDNKKIIKEADYILLSYEEISSKEILNRIKNINNSIKIGIEIDNNKESLDNIDFIQTSNIESLQSLISQNKYEIFFKTKLDCDEDVNWTIPYGFENILKKINIEIELLYGIKEEKRLTMFFEECGKYEEDLTIRELEKFCTIYNCFIYFPIKNLNEIEICKKNFSKIKGISFDLIKGYEN